MTSTLHGYLVIDKPAGWTSHDVVGRLRRLLGERRVGHAGTLDPAATGVLPVAVGAATKTLEFLTDASKTYLAEITVGVETDSFDGDGRVVATADARAVNASAVETSLTCFLGPQLQIPPMHSAVKIGGERLYEAARRGEDVERPARPITFHLLRLVEWRAPRAMVLIDCSKGTYVRSLAHDLGQELGTGAYLSDLVRLRAGPFTLCEAWTIAELTATLGQNPVAASALWSGIALHPDTPLQESAAMILRDRIAIDWEQGKTVPHRSNSTAEQLDGESCRTYDAHGHWRGVGRLDLGAGGWRPVKVVPTGSELDHAVTKG